MMKGSNMKGPASTKPAGSKSVSSIGVRGSGGASGSMKMSAQATKAALDKQCAGRRK